MSKKFVKPLTLNPCCGLVADDHLENILKIYAANLFDEEAIFYLGLYFQQHGLIPYEYPYTIDNKETLRKILES